MILVAYATKRGSTRETAAAIAETLREEGHEVELHAAPDVDDVEGYDAIVLGGAIYMGRWHADARRFLRRHGAAMSRTTLAVFGMGPHTLAEKEVAEARAQLDRALTGVDPATVAIFGGVVDPAELHFPFNRLSASDARDWDAIRAWARRVGALVERNAPHTMPACTVPS